MKLLQNSILKSLAMASLLTVFTCSNQALADDEHPDHDSGTTAEGMVVDAIVVRPVMVAVTVIGAVTFVFTSPFSLLGGNIDEAAEKLVYEPAKYTFVRPLGTFEEDYGDEDY